MEAVPTERDTWQQGLRDHTIRPNYSSEERVTRGMCLLLLQSLLRFPVAPSETLQLPAWPHCKRGSQAAGQPIRRATLRRALHLLVWFGGWKGLITQGLAKPLWIPAELSEESCKTEERIQLPAWEQQQQIQKSIWNQSNANTHLYLKIIYPPAFYSWHMFLIFSRGTVFLLISWKHRPCSPFPISDIGLPQDIWDWVSTSWPDLLPWGCSTMPTSQE